MGWYIHVLKGNCYIGVRESYMFVRSYSSYYSISGLVKVLRVYFIHDVVPYKDYTISIKKQDDIITEVQS